MSYSKQSNGSSYPYNYVATSAKELRNLNTFNLLVHAVKAISTVHDKVFSFTQKRPAAGTQQEEERSQSLPRQLLQLHARCYLPSARYFRSLLLGLTLLPLCFGAGTDWQAEEQVIFEVEFRLQYILSSSSQKALRETLYDFCSGAAAKFY